MDVKLEEKTSENMQVEEKPVESEQMDAQDIPMVETSETGNSSETTEHTSGEAGKSGQEDSTPDESKADNIEKNSETEPTDSVDTILQAIGSLTEKVEQLGKQFDAKIMHTTHEEKIVDQMHAELQKYKEDMYAQLVRPILMDIIEVRDSIMRMSKTFSERPEAEQVVPLKTFSDYAFDVQDILEKNNITIYKSNEGDTFTPIKQRVIKKVNTPVEELHGKIAESLSDGYEYMGKTLSPERVAIYVCDETENKEGEAK